MSVAPSHAPDYHLATATRQGQREIAAASLAAGMIAASRGGIGYTPKAAIALWRDLLADMFPA
jgi:hypothetical protein